MKSDRAVPVAIVGGGYSGTILAAQLARRGIKSALIDGSGRIGRGTAYSTEDRAHLLNVRAEGMSAWACDPDHFAHAFAGAGGDRRGFAERRFYGSYLGAILEEALASGHVEPVEQSAVSAVRIGEGWRLTLADGSAIDAQALALALGNQAPEPLGAFGRVGGRFIANPWGDQARSAIAELAASGEAALLVGTGLTMVDLVLSLDSAGHRGPIVALSRRGLIPRAHADLEPAPIECDGLPQGSARALTRWLRRRSAEVGWRAAVDSLRSHSQALWQAFSPEEQRRFLRHARPWWDVHRHRIAPEVAALIARLVGEGRLEVVAGRVVTASPGERGIAVDIRRRGRPNIETLGFAHVFNCTGPLHAIGRSRDPLLRCLLLSGEVRPDGLGIGLAVEERSRAGARAWALGPLTKGRYWEIVAVPDIREQAAAVAEDIKLELGR